MKDLKHLKSKLNCLMGRKRQYRDSGLFSEEEIEKNETKIQLMIDAIEKQLRSRTNNNPLQY